MSYATKFLYIATRESDCPNSARGAEYLAEISVMGAIGQLANTRDEFIRAGLCFVENFKETADCHIEDIEQNPNHNPEIVHEIRALIAESAEVSYAELFDLLASNWDEQN